MTAMQTASSRRLDLTWRANLTSAFRMLYNIVSGYSYIHTYLTTYLGYLLSVNSCNHALHSLHSDIFSCVVNNKICLCLCRISKLAKRTFINRPNKPHVPHVPHVPYVPSLLVGQHILPEFQHIVSNCFWLQTNQTRKSDHTYHTYHVYRTCWLVNISCCNT